MKLYFRSTVYGGKRRGVLLFVFIETLMETLKWYFLCFGFICISSKCIECVTFCKITVEIGKCIRDIVVVFAPRRRICGNSWALLNRVESKVHRSHRPVSRIPLSKSLMSSGERVISWDSKPCRKAEKEEKRMDYKRVCDQPGKVGNVVFGKRIWGWE